MKYLAVLGRQPEISIAELEALFSDVRQIAFDLATFEAEDVKIARLGGALKIAVKIDEDPLEYLRNLPEGKITFGISDYSASLAKRRGQVDAFRIKQALTRQGRSVRAVVDGPQLSTATSLYNGFNGDNPRKVEFIRVNKEYYRVTGVQDIDAYAARDQARPARDAKVGMLPPKLAQILINLCGPLPLNARVLDPFCGTGVVLQEALLMGYQAYGTDINERMIEYSDKNLKYFNFENYKVEVGDATSYTWAQPIDAVACEAFLGQPMSLPPAEIKLKQEKQTCRTIILGFLKNLAEQIASGTPVVVAVPAWLRQNGKYSRLEILDEINKMGYNVSKKTREGLIYHRDSQVVARDIIILRKK